jgi:hypothetical protein
MNDFTQISPNTIFTRGFPVIDINIISLFKECTPKILVMTDGLRFTATDFGLTDFVDTLKASTIHGITPIVKTALRTAGTADHPSFTFTSTSFSKSKYDVLFLFGSYGGGSLPAAEIAVIETFMDAGGGVFATGDHANLGKYLCGSIKRVSEMRRWTGPSAGGTDRISTNDPGTNNSFEFGDQSDAIAQKIYPAYYTTNGGAVASEPHFLLQHPTKNIIEVLPDHPHESECIVPASVADPAIWPKDSVGGDVAPELVALSMSYGGAFPGKAAISAPRSFGAIGAYDGHETEDCVGRIAVDATWHHFINVNLIASGAGPGISANADAYDRINTYFRNIADWLMPKKVRRCLRWPIFLSAAKLYPLGEFLMEHEDRKPSLESTIELGKELRATLRRFMSSAEVNQLEDDLLDLANPRLKYRLRKFKESRKLQDAVAKDFITEDLYRSVSAGAAICAAAKMLKGGENLAANFNKMDGEKGLEAHCKEQMNEMLRELNNHFNKGHAAIDELLETFN